MLDGLEEREEHETQDSDPPDRSDNEEDMMEDDEDEAEMEQLVIHPIEDTEEETSDDSSLEDSGNVTIDVRHYVDATVNSMQPFRTLSEFEMLAKAGECCDDGGYCFFMLVTLRSLA